MADTMSTVVLLQTGTVVMATVLLGIAALNDIATRAIPDGVPLVLMFIGIVVHSVSRDVAAALGASAAVFLLGMVSWRLGWMGGGDVKLLAACAGLVSPGLVPQLVLNTAMFGGGLACSYLALRCVARPIRLQPHVARPRLLAVRIWHVERWRIGHRPTLPYGCAIAAGTLLTLVGG
jgi:prepilin peptidase CpaA